MQQSCTKRVDVNVVDVDGQCRCEVQHNPIECLCIPGAYRYLAFV